MAESQTTEWKASWRDEYIKWICGFANAQGGRLTVGKNDQGVVTGMPNAARLLEDIPNKVRDLLGIVVEVNLRKDGPLEYLEIDVDPHPHPVSYRGQYHIRSGSIKQELKGAALDKFLLRKLGKHWDSVPIPGAQIEDLCSLDPFRALAAGSNRLDDMVIQENDHDLLEKLRLLEDGYLKRAAVLLFHPDPEAFITGAYVKIGYFKTNSELLYQDEVHGNLFEQVDRTLDILLTKYLKALIAYEDIHRVENYPMPKEALREAVLNAIAHKDYGSGVPIQISVYDDKLMIWNNGRLHEGWTMESLIGKHSSQPYNPDIANAFFRAGLIEAWGRGIEKMCDACKAAETPEPVITCEEPGFWTVFDYQQVTPREKVLDEHTSAMTDQVPAQSSTQSPVLVLRLLHQLANRNRSAGELRNELGLSHRATFRNNYLKSALNMGLIEYTIPEKNNSRLQKYRLTTKGREAPRRLIDTESSAE